MKRRKFIPTAIICDNKHDSHSNTFRLHLNKSNDIWNDNNSNTNTMHAQFKNGMIETLYAIALDHK